MYYFVFLALLLFHKHKVSSLLSRSDHMRPKNKIKLRTPSQHLASGKRKRKKKAKLVNVSSSHSPSHVVKGKNSYRMEWNPS